MNTHCCHTPSLPPEPLTTSPVVICMQRDRHGFERSLETPKTALCRTVPVSVAAAKRGTHSD
ncbi:hypothetical protein GCM10010917_18170 [Paenibacillus physcomitrellae]|uniref:Uncharacterized protein n=1 Tax=Paenibacillus physcomitrellae TaxID=1619311 RepID=A0ABQ1FYZ9_9BACL|nr:hypothetical protein GCM10010917_18170 [Paenibacillus physcomitrellae]